MWIVSQDLIQFKNQSCNIFHSHIGFEILAFPCNQFRKQEPGSNEEIQQFACTRYKAEFPIFDKVGQKLLFRFVYLKCDNTCILFVSGLI